MSSNPFDDDQNNPFSDPSISTALQSTFVSIDHSAGASASAVGQGKGKGDLATSLASKEEELRRREQELEARERNLEQQQQALREHGLKPPNWPPFYPIIYHDINEEVPEPSRPLMLKIYRFWLATIVIFFINMIACLGLLISHSTSSGASDFGVSLIYFFTMSALSFYLWYRPAYTAFSKESALFFYIFLLFEGFHFLFCAYMSVGLPGSGSSGIINMLSVLSDGKYGVATLAIIASAGWILGAVGAFFLWTAVNKHAKMGGHSLETARTQAVTMGVLASNT